MSILVEQHRREVGQQIKKRYQELGLTLEQLEKKSGYDEKTIRNVIAGEPARPATLHAILKALEMDLPSAGTTTAIADDKHGGYTQRAFTKYVGQYAAYRWAYDGSRSIVRLIYSLAWCPDSRCGIFKETQRYQDGSTGKAIVYTRTGEIYANNDAGVMHLLISDDGLLQLVTLTKLQPPDPIIRGSVLGQSRRTFYQQPAVSPLYLEKIDATSAVEVVAGEMSSDCPEYAQVALNLTDVERNIVMVAFSPPEPVGKQRDGKRSDSEHTGCRAA